LDQFVRKRGLTSRINAIDGDTDWMCALDGSNPIGYLFNEQCAG
jgi:hypothetical protein